MAIDKINATALLDGGVSTADIADDAVTGVKVSGLTNSSNGIIKADGDGTFSTTTADLVDDTTPQLGGDLASNGNDINFADNDKAKFGAGDDLQIYHDGSNNHTYIEETGSGSLRIRGENLLLEDSSGKDYLNAVADAQVELSHNGVKKFETTSTGVAVTGGLSLDSTSQSEWPMVHLDSQQLSGSYSQIDISISPTLSGYSAYKVIVSSWQLNAEGELWVNYGYGSSKKGGWYGGYYRVGEGNSSGQEGYGNQPQCEIVATNTTAFSSNSYPCTGEFTFFPLEASNRGRIHYQAIARLNVGLSSSITGGALTTNTSVADKIIFYSDQNTTRFHYKLYGIKI